MLTIYEGMIPSRLLETEAARLHELLPGPTLVHLPGRRPEPLFVSVLQHGDEITGWEVVRALHARYRARGRERPRALSVFIGNVAAARAGLRFLPGQPDDNRVWGRPAGAAQLPEERMMQQVVEAMRLRRVFASVDVHNDTGANPHYAACAVVIRPRRCSSPPCSRARWCISPSRRACKRRPSRRSARP